MTNTQTFETYIAAFRPRFEEYLEQYFQKAESELSAIHPASNNILPVIRDFVMRGGKRIRPALIGIGYQAAGESQWERIVQAMISVELLHAFFLIHDDIMDRSDIRRGRPTMHREFEHLLPSFDVKASDQEHTATSLAILAGDLCCTMAYDALLELPLPSDQVIQTLRYVRSVMTRTIVGQLLDMVPPRETSEQYVGYVHDLKTARYTIEAPLHVGMMLAMSPDSRMDEMSRFAIPVGVAFQIQDDLLGMFGTEKQIGKSAASDLAEGKETLLSVYVREHAEPAARQRFFELHGRHGITAADLEEARKILTNCGAVEHSNQRARELILDAKSALAAASIEAESRDILTGLADYVIARNA